MDKCIFYPLQPLLLALQVFTPYLLQILCHMCFIPSWVTIAISCMGFWDCCSATPKYPSNWFPRLLPVVILCSPGFVVSHAQGETGIPFAIWTWLHTPPTGPLPILLIKVRQGCHQYWKRAWKKMQGLWPKKFKRRHVGRCVVLHLRYQILMVNLTWPQNELSFTVSYVLWVRHISNHQQSIAVAIFERVPESQFSWVTC